MHSKEIDIFVYYTIHMRIDALYTSCNVKINIKESMTGNHTPLGKTLNN